MVSFMLTGMEESWNGIRPLVSVAGSDVIELNYGCPPGGAERGMGAAVGQVPEYVEQVTRWCKTYCSLAVIVKLTPNITDVRVAARARSEEHTSELQSLMRISYAVFCLKKKRIYY